MIGPSETGFLFSRSQMPSVLNGQEKFVKQPSNLRAGQAPLHKLSSYLQTSGMSSQKNALIEYGRPTWSLRSRTSMGFLGGRATAVRGSRPTTWQISSENSIFTRTPYGL